jgi:hypothetical protein
MSQFRQIATAASESTTVPGCRKASRNEVSDGFGEPLTVGKP